MKIFLFLVLCVFISQQSFAQFEFKIKTDKSSYESGELVKITASLTNLSNSIKQVLFMNAGSCQAEYRLNQFESFETVCLPVSEEVQLQPNESRIYQWTMDPKTLGIIQHSGEYQLVGIINFLTLPMSTVQDIYLSDTTYFLSEAYLGGLLKVGYLPENITDITHLKDSLQIKTNWVVEGVYGQNIEEWEIQGFNLDSLFFSLDNHPKIEWVEYQRQNGYDSIYHVVSIGKNHFKPNDIFVSEAYPNPFNPTTTFYIELHIPTEITVELYSILGEKMATVFNGYLSSGIKHFIPLDASSYSSGIYFYRVTSKYFTTTKKIMLLK